MPGWNLKMDERLGREAILERLHTEYGRLMAIVGELTSEQMVVPGVAGEWSAKDVLAHLIFWTQFPVQEIEAARRGECYVFDHERDVNSENVAYWQAYPVEAVIETLNGAFEEVVALVEGLPDSAFKPDNALECLLGDTITGTLDNNTYDHYALHEAQIRAWIQNRKE